MNKIIIPFCFPEKDDEERIEELFSAEMLEVFQKVKADRIALVFNGWKNYEKNRAVVKRAMSYFADYGMDVAVWLNTLTHIDHGDGFTKKKYANGSEKNWCPFDEKFQKHFAGYVAEYAKSGVRLIYLDDDFRMSATGGISCFCKYHMQRYKELLGNDITAEKIFEELRTGKPSKYRDAWAKVNGEALVGLAKAIRAEVDKVDPTIRVGICTSPATLFGVDGVTAFELSEILAGNTKPFLRTVGAPYWSYYVRDYWKARLNDIIGLERLEASYLEEMDFQGEIFAEGDTYPRPRFTTPASHLELFHAGIVVEDKMDGILKYIGEYTNKGSYEKGYSRLAAVNGEKIEKISKAFSGTEKEGYRIFEVQNKMQSMEFKGEDVEFLEHGGGIPASIRVLNDASMPYTFAGEQPIVAFGDNARYLTEKELKNGLITDIVGATILKEKGIDVGFTTLEKCSDVRCISEYYPQYNQKEFVDFKVETELFRFNFNDGVEILTNTKIGEEVVPVTYRYMGNGLKIIVCCVDVTCARFAHGYFGSYTKQRLLTEAYQWLTGEDLAAVCLGCPMVMPIVGKKEDKLVVGLWNIFEDRIFDQEIKLSKEYTKAEFIGCTGSLKGKTLILDNLNAFDFCAIVLE